MADQETKQMPQQVPAAPSQLSTKLTASPTATSITTRPNRDIYDPRGFKEARERQDAFDKSLAIKHQYSNINNAAKADKIAALKNPNIDVHKLNNPTDALAASYNRWKSVAADARKRYTPEQQKQIASNYYDRDIVPFYKNLGAEGPTKDQWLAKAYDPHGALGVEVEDFFHSQITSGIIRGLQGVAGDLEEFGGTMVNMLGNAVASPFHQGMGKGYFQHAQDVTRAQAKPEATAHDSAWDKYRPESLSETLASDSKLLSHFASQDEFWHQVNPAKGFTDTAVSTVTELVASLPLFGGLEGGTKVLGEAALKAAPGNLTRVLTATPAGIRVAQALQLGADGLAYGALTRPIEDKGKAKWDALTFMALGSTFSYAGEKLKLRDVLAKSGDKAAIKAHAEEIETARLSIEEGKRPATPDEKRAAYVEHHARVISQMGSEGLSGVYSAALSHIHEEETSGMSEEEIFAKMDKMRKEDPVQAAVTYSVRGFINDVLGGRRYSDLEHAGKFDVYSQIASLIRDAEEHLNRAEGPIKEANTSRGKPDIKNPSTRITVESIKNRLMAELASHGVQNSVKPEQIQARAEAEFAEAQAKGAAEAERLRNTNPISEAKDISAARNTAKPEGRKSGQLLKTESKSETVSPRRVSKDAEASHNYNHSNYVNAVAKKADKTLTQFYDGMESEDFEKELEEYFYPKALKEGGLYFEREHTVEGKQNPNFLAFMYNYKDQMPKETAAKLDHELEESLKFEKHFKGYRITSDQKWHFALQMYNHVDTFLGSTSFIKNGEKNIFRSTQSDLLNPTKYQYELLGEMHSQNMKTLTEMFKSPRGRKAAKTAYRMLSGELNSIFAERPTLMSAKRYRTKADELSDFLISKSKEPKSTLNVTPWEF